MVVGASLELPQWRLRVTLAFVLLLTYQPSSRIALLCFLSLLLPWAYSSAICMHIDTAKPLGTSSCILGPLCGWTSWRGGSLQIEDFSFSCLWCQFPADILETFSIFFVSFWDGLFSRAMLILGSTHFDVWTIHIVCVYIGSTTQAKETCQIIIFPCLRTSKWLIPLDSFWQGIHLIHYDLFSPHFKHNLGKSETMLRFSGNLFAAHFLVSWWNGVTTTTSCCWHLQNKTRCIWCGWWLKSCTIG